MCRTGIIVPPNITMISFPAKCPELKPAGKYLAVHARHWLSKRIFNSFDDIVDTAAMHGTNF